MLTLNCPLVCLDVETTGVDPELDRIVEIALIKVYPDGTRNPWQTLVNPGMPIPPSVSAIHGIRDEDVKDKPKFVDLLPILTEGFHACDFLGYNVEFDVRFLKAEFKRNGGVDCLNGRLIDAYRLFLRMEDRSLSGAARFYLNTEHVGAHNAMADTEMALRIFEAQLQRYSLPDTVEEVYKLLYETPKEGHLDIDGKLRWFNNHATLSFGKFRGVPLQTVPKDYIRWLLTTVNLSDAVKTILQETLNGNAPRKS